MRVVSLNNSAYFILFIDDYSRMTRVYFLKTKSQAFSEFKRFKSLVETQSGEKILMLRTDNGGEFESQHFEDFCKEA